VATTGPQTEEAYEYRETTTATTIDCAFVTSDDERVFNALRDRMWEEYSALDSARADAHQRGDDVFEVTREMSDLPRETCWNLHRKSDQKWGIAYGNAVTRGSTEDILTRMTEPVHSPALVVERSAVISDTDTIRIPLDGAEVRLSVESPLKTMPGDALVSLVASDDEVSLRVSQPNERAFSRRDLQFVPEDVAEARRQVRDAEGLPEVVTAVTDALLDQYPAHDVAQVLLFVAGARAAVSLSTTQSRQPLIAAAAERLGADTFPLATIGDELLTNDPGCAEGARRIQQRTGDFDTEGDRARTTGVALGYPTAPIEFYVEQTTHRVPAGMMMAQQVVRMLDEGVIDKRDCTALKLVPYTVCGEVDAVSHAVATGHQHAQALLDLDETYGVTVGKRVLSELDYESDPSARTKVSP
jgi:hypothetical protein